MLDVILGANFRRSLSSKVNLLIKDLNLPTSSLVFDIILRSDLRFCFKLNLFIYNLQTNNERLINNNIYIG